MHCKSFILAILASSSVVSAAPIPDPGNGDCIGSSFSPTNCNSANSGQVNVEPNIDLTPTVSLREVEVEEEKRDNNCIGSSFSPTNCNSPNSDQINVEPNVNVAPNVNLGLADTVNSVVGSVKSALAARDYNTIGSSFSPTNNNSPNSNQANVKPNVNASPNISLREAEPEPQPEVEIEERDNNCIGSSFSPTNCNSPGSNQVNVEPDVNASPNVGT